MSQFSLHANVRSSVTLANYSLQLLMVLTLASVLLVPDVQSAPTNDSTTCIANSSCEECFDTNCVFYNCEEANQAVCGSKDVAKIPDQCKKPKALTKDTCPKQPSNSSAEPAASSTVTPTNETTTTAAPSSSSTTTGSTSTAATDTTTSSSTTSSTTTTTPLTTSTTTTTPSTTSTTTTTTTAAPSPSTSTSTQASSSTVVPSPSAQPLQPATSTSGRRFDGPSFIGGMVLAFGLMAISFVSFKFYKTRTERNYLTL